MQNADKTEKSVQVLRFRVFCETEKTRKNSLDYPGVFENTSKLKINTVAHANPQHQSFLTLYYPC